jgi:hypothetical protein
VRCAAGCCIKSVKSVFRAHAPRGRDARASFIDIKSDSMLNLVLLKVLCYRLGVRPYLGTGGVTSKGHLRR